MFTLSITQPSRCPLHQPGCYGYTPKYLRAREALRAKQQCSWLPASRVRAASLMASMMKMNIRARLLPRKGFAQDSWRTRVSFAVPVCPPIRPYQAMASQRSYVQNVAVVSVVKSIHTKWVTYTLFQPAACCACEIIAGFTCSAFKNATLFAPGPCRDFRFTYVPLDVAQSSQYPDEDRRHSSENLNVVYFCFFPSIKVDTDNTILTSTPKIQQQNLICHWRVFRMTSVRKDLIVETLLRYL